MKLPMLVAALTTASAIAHAAPVVVRIDGARGQPMGQARLEEGPRGVLMRLELTGLRPGWHAVHFHAVGRCDEPQFTSAGGHVHAGSGAVVHGLLNPASNDSGDLPNVYASPEGVAFADVFSPFVSLSGAAGRVNLLDADGSAIVLHDNLDDYQSQPIGGAGGRAACGVIN